MSPKVKEIFEPHMIAQTLKKDFERVIGSLEMVEFEKRNYYKSAMTRSADEQLVKMLVFKLDQYRKGWVSANMMSTNELWEKSKLLDEQREQLKVDAIKINQLVNEMIIILKPNMDEEKLKQLRDLETEIRKYE